MGKSKKRKAQERAEGLQEQSQQRADRYKDQYKDLDTSNPYLNQINYMAGLSNNYEGMENVYSGLENTMEDLTINQKQAEFQAQQFQQSQANILSGLRSSAGGSGIAALAQSLAQQGQIASQQAAADIGRQESANMQAQASEASRLQAAEAGYSGQIQQMQRGEAARLQQATADMNQQIQQSEIAGEIYSRDLERSTLENLMGMELSSAGGYADQAMFYQSQRGKGWDVAGQFAAGVGQGVGSAVAGSDIKLKKNIQLVGYSPSGLKIYAFEYIDKVFGDGIYQGVMSNEIPRSAVIKHEDGYDLVDYSKIDVEFKKII